MSLSVNNPTLATVARSHRHAELMDSKNCVKAGFGAPAPSSSGVAMRTDNLKFNSGDAAVSAGALTKLFDMLEAVFKSMREMFSGRDQSADRLVHNLPIRTNQKAPCSQKRRIARLCPTLY